MIFVDTLQQRQHRVKATISIFWVGTDNLEIYGECKAAAEVDHWIINVAHLPWNQGDEQIQKQR